MEREIRGDLCEGDYLVIREAYDMTCATKRLTIAAQGFPSAYPYPAPERGFDRIARFTVGCRTNNPSSLLNGDFDYIPLISTFRFDDDYPTFHLLFTATSDQIRIDLPFSND